MRIFGDIKFVMGIGVALACIFWVLGHLVAFYFFGHILVGEENGLVLFSEITLITSGLLCFGWIVYRKVK